MSELKEEVAKITALLKDFQQATVDYVLDQMYREGRNKILVADEVGLGKTVIAKGVILQSIAHHHKRKGPFHVVYVCSNQVLAHQNVAKLSAFDQESKPLNRLVFLAFKPEKSRSKLRLSALTPGTSFQLTNSVGVKEERAILFALFHKYQTFRNLRKTLLRFLQGNRQVDEDNWRELADRYAPATGISHDKTPQYRTQLHARFRRRLQETQLTSHRFPKVYEYLRLQAPISMWRGIIRLLKKLKKKGREPLDFSYEVIRALRHELTLLCVEYLDADLFILDEFQRFKTLLDGEDNSEVGEIAKMVLRNENARALLLSATPFKPFTTQLDQLAGEDHYSELSKLVKYLGGEKGEALWEGFRKDQQAFFNLLRHPRIALERPEETSNVRKQLEKKFKTFISRNERMNVGTAKDNMILSHTADRISVIKADVENFIALDQLVETLRAVSNDRIGHFGSTVEFSKSAPYALSYLYGYKLRELLDTHRESEEVNDFFQQNDAAWLNFRQLNHYQAFGYENGKPIYPNGKLRVLAEECFREGGEFLLWVPPAKPIYPFFGAWSQASDFSKILIFSGWKMVPRAVSTLISYESERRTIGSEDLKNTQEEEKRTYFTSETKRHPAPLLTHPTRIESLHMTNLCVTYPSRVLAQSVLPLLSNREDAPDFHQLRSELAGQLKQDLFSKGLDELCVEAKPDHKWYWLAPALLDGHEDPTLIGLNQIIKEAKGGKKNHFNYLREVVTELLQGAGSTLGQFPEDLFLVLAEIALAAPGCACLRVWMRTFSFLSPEAQLSQAYKLSDSFLSLFNKPESISAIRMSSNRSVYWRQVLEYCAAGNFESMVEEYVYLLSDCESKTPVQITEQFESVLSVRSVPIKVDFNNKKHRSENMRCHFAINYGSQKIGTEGGSNRMVNIREVFNSPFRPFVLTSTSVGQEGLDFHYYCRKIFHWNLPHNAIDLEQREGRINRFKCFVIRKKVAELISKADWGKVGESVWKGLFQQAEKSIKAQGDSDLVPFWYLDAGKDKIERFVPIHEFSKDLAKYEQLKRTLAIYRLTFGQPRQEELIEAFKQSGLSDPEIHEIRENMLINLSPLSNRES